VQCPSCNASISEEDRFCQNCGAAVAPSIPAAGKAPRWFLAAAMALIALVAAVAMIWLLIRSSRHDGGPEQGPVAARPPSAKIGTLSEGPASKEPAIMPPNDTVPSLATRLIGSWRGGRHLTEFRADGTFVLDADVVPEPAGGGWKLDGNRLTQAFRQGNSLALIIESIDEREMITSDPVTGQRFASQRESIARVAFDQCSPGNVTGDEFKADGLRIAAVKGRLLVAAAAAAMVMPGTRKQVLMVDGDRVTEMAFAFDPPVKSFTITLPGIGGGSSFPTYQLTAYNRAGQGFDAIRQEHHVPTRPAPARLTLNSGEMSRVVLSVDNRFGNTAWATYNCLPIAEIELER
jgi:hypothetical protein